MREVLAYRNTVVREVLAYRNTVVREVLAYRNTVVRGVLAYRNTVVIARGYSTRVLCHQDFFLVLRTVCRVH